MLPGMALLVCPLPPSQCPYLNGIRFLVGLLVAYTAAMFILYSVAPLLYRMSSSAYYNISLLTSDFYGLLFGLFLFVRVATYFFQKMANHLRWNSTTHPSGFTSRRLLWYLWVWSYTSGMPHVSILSIRVR